MRQQWFRLSYVVAAQLAVALISPASVSHAASFSFSTGTPDGRIATASRPGGGGKLEVETADDFILESGVSLTSATFTGLLIGGGSLADVNKVALELYRVFPLDSVTPPSGNVPTRVNSPSDNAFASRDFAGNTLTYSASVVNGSFTAGNSVINGINKIPTQTTGGEGPVTGQEVQFNINFSTALDLGPGHYFIVPQIGLSTGDFLWLSAPKPTTPPFSPDLQTWIRNENLDPDWLRVGTDVVGGNQAPTYNASFSVAGVVVPEACSTLGLFTFGCVLVLGCARKFPLTVHHAV